MAEGKRCGFKGDTAVTVHGQSLTISRQFLKLRKKVVRVMPEILAQAGAVPTLAATIRTVVS